MPPERRRALVAALASVASVGAAFGAFAELARAQTSNIVDAGASSAPDAADASAPDADSTSAADGASEADAEEDPSAPTPAVPAPSSPASSPAGSLDADPLPLDARAENVSFDARARQLDLDGDVRLDESPFFLRSDHLRIRRVALGLELEGDGRLVFCPCLGAPLSVGFSGGTVAPPGDLILRSPRLQLFGLPVLWLPAIWLRSPGRVGVLPPDIAWRGTDGLFLGEGVHLPFRTDDKERGLDLRAGGYVQGGAAVEGRLVDGTGTTRIAWDHLRGDGLTVDARGAVPATPDRDGSPSVAWDVDALRGARGLRSTSDVDAVARPVDRARASAAWRVGSDGAGGQWTFAVDERAAAARGGELGQLGMQGPEAIVRTAGGAGHGDAAVTYDARLAGGAFSGVFLPTTSFARFDGGVLAATHLAPFGVEVRARGAADAADDGQSSSIARSAAVRGVLSLPLSRAFGLGPSSDGPDAWVHRTEPRLVVGALSTGGDPLLGTWPGRGFAGAARGSSWVTSFEWANALGRWGARQGAEAVLAAGSVGGVDGPRPVGRARASADTRYLALSLDAAAVLGSAGTSSAGTSAGPGEALYGRARVGALDGVNVGVTVAGRSGVDPVVARALFDTPLDPNSGFVTSTGWTLSSRATLPVTRNVAPSGGADVDLASGTLVAARGGLELRDGCGCLIVRATAAHRIGRPGVDAGVTIDLAPR